VTTFQNHKHRLRCGTFFCALLFACTVHGQSHPQSRGPKAISAQDISSLLIQRVEPVYPDDARYARIEGVVILRITIGTNGSIKSVKATSGPPQLIPAAALAVRQWQYESYVLEGNAVEVQTTVEIPFKLARAARVHAIRSDPVKLKLPSGAVVGFHLTESYGPCLPGTHFRVKILAPIDSDQNRFGDPVEGNVVGPVVVCNKQPALYPSSKLYGSFELFGDAAGTISDSFGIEFRMVGLVPGQKFTFGTSFRARMDADL